ncbi:hypothetical protein ROZALSC1DRAFT_30640 [Rozella allomycis CSF55]|uniref:Peroxisomal membrane protein 4 n=1 Tax=Rozella allomycis (strain CSF55) TaxID=988480 RepID=A0A075AX07_ROZAC|nr:hypothetical protein O9G_001996 [Rozella allomycis CSF55]RKP17568.1 hypothetical protein ROZALSC1DRAFT_30640 [Rozella allomycis CSF55]|eukprot:EPZ34865.1 hypothetical protein O9G_001996 [Rozella allomycis CSF55]
MTFLFRSGPLEEKIRIILNATIQHATNLAKFVTIYKTLMLVFKLTKGKENLGDSFLAGLFGGYMVFGEDNPINHQIVLYLFSRDVLGLAKLAVKKGLIKKPDGNAFAYFSAFVWGIVMLLFRHERDVLQTSLQASMQYLYNDSDYWDSWRNLLWHNK